MLDKDLLRDFLAVTASVAVLGIGVGGTLPLTALVLTARGLGPEVIGWLTAAVAVGGVAGTWVAPSATLRFGRRNVMLFCVVMAAAAVVPLQSVDSLWGWAALRLVFGAAMAPLFVIGEAWISSLPADAVRGRVVGIYSSCFTFCQVLGPVLTGAVARYPGRAFWICGSVFLLGLPGIAFARDSRPPSAPGGPSSLSAAATAKDATASWSTIVRRAPTILAGAALFASFDNIMLSFLPLFALAHGKTRFQALLATSLVFLGDAMLQFGAGALADRFGNARVLRQIGIALCVLLPLLPVAVYVPGLWEIYLYVLGGVAGSVYTLSIVASGELFSGAALLRASGLITLTWNVASSLAPPATGIVVQRFGESLLTAVLWVMALGFVYATFTKGRAARASHEVPLAPDVR